MTSLLARTLSLSLVLLTPLAAQAADPTDLAAHGAARRKAGKDAAARAAVTLDFVLAVAKKAKADMNPDMFPGIKEKLSLAAADVVELKKEKGAEDPEVVRMVERVKATLTEVQGIIDYIKANKLGSVAMPADVYSGSDKNQIKTAITEAWKQRYPSDKILKVCLPKTSWERKKTEEKVGSEWKRYDISSMVVKVIVDKDAETATIHTVYVQINHHTNEELQVGQKGAGFFPEDMAKKNVKG
jgi:hypothetical protein